MEQYSSSCERLNISLEPLSQSGPSTISRQQLQQPTISIQQLQQLVLCRNIYPNKGNLELNEPLKFMTEPTSKAKEPEYF
jgi:hypothetical protein